MITIPGRIPITIYPLFWIMAGLIGWLNSGGSLTLLMIWVVVILFSVIIHEFGHALTALAFGQETRIELVGLGGLTHRDGKRLSLWKEFIIVLNGPLAGFLLFLGAFAIWKYIGSPEQFNTLFLQILFITGFANLIWTIFNLLPIHPLDGGRLLGIILESTFGLKGLRAGFLLSGLLALGLGLVFFIAGNMLGGAIFMLLAFESYRAWQGSTLMSANDDDDVLRVKFQRAEEAMRLGHEEEALKNFEEIRTETKRGVLYTTATEYLGHILARMGKMHEVYDLLAPLKRNLSIDGSRLLHQAAYQTGNIKEAVTIGSEVYRNDPNYDTALLNALCYASLDQVQPCVGWLQRAISDGLPKPLIVIHREEFDGIRNTEAFKELQSSFQA